MNRRRLLSEDYIAWLKSLTCQFYGRCFDTYSLRYTDCKYYMRNAYAFTAALDIDTIKQIQQI